MPFPNIRVAPFTFNSHLPGIYWLCLGLAPQTSISLVSQTAKATPTCLPDPLSVTGYPETTSFITRLGLLPPQPFPVPISPPLAVRLAAPRRFCLILAEPQ